MSNLIDKTMNKSDELLQQEIEKRSQVELELNRHRQYIDTQSAKLQLLNELATGLSQVITDEETYKLVALKTTKLLDVERASVALLNETKDFLEVFALDGTKGAIPTGAKLPVEGTQLGEAVKTKKTIIVNDTAKSSWLDAMKLRESGMGSLMDAPLIVSGSIIGTLNVGAVQKNMFTKRDSDLLLQAATLLATTLEKNRLLNQTTEALKQSESQASRLDLLNELALELVSTSNQQETFNVVAKYLTKIIEGNRATLAILTEEGDSLEVMGLEGLVLPFKVGARLPVKGTGLGYATQTGRLIYISDTTQSNFIEAQKAASEASIRSIMIAPLHVGGKIIGTLNIGTTKVDAYPSELQQLMKQIAALLATTLENHQLIEQTQQALSEEALLRQTLEISRERDDLELAFSSICQLMAHYFSVPRTGFALLSEDRTIATNIAEYVSPDSGLPKSLKHSWNITDHPIAQFIIERKTPFYSGDLQNDAFAEPFKALLKAYNVSSLWAIPVFVEDEVVGIISLDSIGEIDITPRKIALAEAISVQISQTLVRIQATQALQTSEEQFRTVIANLPTPIAITNISTGAIPYVNYAFTELFGGTLEEIANKQSAIDYYANPEDRAQIIEAFNREGQISHTEVQFKKQDGSFVWADIAMQHINYFGTPAILTGFYDTTARKQTEEMLRQAKESAEEANYLKSKFLSNMSHELRTPLNAIINMTGFVMDGMLGDVNEEQVDALEKTVDSGNHLLSLINDVLDLTKIEAGLMNVVFEPVDLMAVLQGICATGKGLVKEADIELISNLNQDLPQIIGDRRRLRQIFLNLVSNAVKYTKEGSVSIEAFVENQGVHVTVTDTGIGIAPEDFDLIFQEFQQAKTNTGNVASTGLGLPITKQLVDMHDGQIWFESVLEEGSVFHVYLPLVPSNVDNAVMFEKNSEVAI